MVQRSWNPGSESLFMLMTLGAPFLGGLIVEALAVLWVHYAERDKKHPLFGVSLLLGAANVLGIGTAIQHWQSALAFILGYGLGPLAGLHIKKQRKASGSSRAHEPTTALSAVHRNSATGLCIEQPTQ